jgi:hypothetical protein
VPDEGLEEHLGGLEVDDEALLIEFKAPEDDLQGLQDDLQARQDEFEGL